MSVNSLGIFKHLHIAGQSISTQVRQEIHIIPDGVCLQLFISLANIKWIATMSS